MLKDKKLTYISLFSSAGVGCFGFKKANFECIVTNELIERRLDVQKINQKCKFDTGYICADITLDETKQKIYKEINKWKTLGNDRVDVLIATPPCQGMSVANHKKNENEINRNSLVVESILLVKNIKPRFFVFENVAAFMKTGCTAPDGSIKQIGDVILEELGKDYVIASRVINFKNYGSNSSRTRTLIIGVSKNLEEYIAPIELFPSYEEEKTLKKVIGDLPKLEWSEISKNDFYHGFRIYPLEMRCWISDLKEGESAFDNKDELKRPHKVIDGKIVPNIQKNGDKYTRQYWNKVAPCIHTRNDQLASQNTVHPEEDRVFSIRELMRIMTIPNDFKWIDKTLKELNSLNEYDKKALLKKEEIKIRQSIGEAVPTNIFYKIASNIKDFMSQEHLSKINVNKTIDTYQLNDVNNLIDFIKNNPLKLGISSLASIAELSNSKRENNGAYYTNKFILNEIYKELPKIEKDTINILEPSVGVGNFLPFIFKKYENIKNVIIDVVDIDGKNIEILKLLLNNNIPSNVTINFINEDSLLYNFNKHYDLVIGNPPFVKLKAKDAEKYLKNNLNKNTTNTFEYFLEKFLNITDYLIMITPKYLLNSPEFNITRDILSTKKVDCIQDFGELGFKGVLVETICLFIDNNGKPKETKIESLTFNKLIIQKQDYIMDKTYPYWIIYRDDFFDSISKQLEFNKFKVFRDRQITNSNTLSFNDENCIRVIKSRNISDNGKEIIDIPGYDSYIKKQTVESLSTYKYIDKKNVYITPNMTYKPRVMRNVGNTVVNGSVAILIPKEDIELSDKQMEYFSSEEYRKFYQIARNYQTRSLNVDATSVFFYGILKDFGHE